MQQCLGGKISALACLAAAVVGCSGVQTGDGDLPACDLQTEPLADLDSVPPALGQRPRDLLAPLAAGIAGELKRPDGTRVPLRFEVTLNEGSAELVSRAETSPAVAVCAASIQLDGSLHADGAEVFSGTGPVRITASEGQVWLEFDSRSFSTTLHPAGNPCANAASLVMQLELGAGCTWHGDWGATIPLVAGESCSNDFPEPLGAFAAPGECR